MRNDKDIETVQFEVLKKRVIEERIVVSKVSQSEPWWGGRTLRPNEYTPVYLGGTDFGRRDETEDDPKWFYECLDAAMKIINVYHADCSDFFQRSNFKLFIQRDWQNAYGYIYLEMQPIYPIFIHKTLKDDTGENRRMVVVVLVHELLHAIHPDWLHDRINPEEQMLANKAGYYDALCNMKILYLSGKMRLCAD